MPICAHLFWSRTRSAGQKASQDSACADTLFCCSAGGRRARSASDGLRGQIIKRRAQELFFRQRRGAKRRTSVRTLRGQGCRIRRGRPRRSKGATCSKKHATIDTCVFHSTLTCELACRIATATEGTRKLLLRVSAACPEVWQKAYGEFPPARGCWSRVGASVAVAGDGRREGRE